MSNKRAPTKTQTILAEAKARSDAAQQKVRDASIALDTARSVYNALSENYYALERSLARKPRSTNGSGKSSSPAPSVKKKSSRVRNLNELPVVSTEDETVSVFGVEEKEIAHEQHN